MGLFKLKILSVFVILSLCSNISIAQGSSPANDSTNKFDSRGRKDGLWIEYLTKSFRSEKNAEKASFYRFIRFVNGERFDFEIVPKHYITETITDHQDTSSNKQGLVLLDGTYKVYEIRKHFLFRDGGYRRENVLIRECVFKKGFLQILYTYSMEDGNATYYFEEQHKQYPFSYVLKEYSTSGVLLRNAYVVLENSRYRRIEICM